MSAQRLVAEGVDRRGRAVDVHGHVHRDVGAVDDDVHLGPLARARDDVAGAGVVGGHGGAGALPALVDADEGAVAPVVEAQRVAPQDHDGHLLGAVVLLVQDVAQDDAGVVRLLRLGVVLHLHHDADREGVADDAGVRGEVGVRDAVGLADPGGAAVGPVAVARLDVVEDDVGAQVQQRPGVEHVLGVALVPHELVGGPVLAAVEAVGVGVAVVGVLGVRVGGGVAVVAVDAVAHVPRRRGRRAEAAVVVRVPVAVVVGVQVAGVPVGRVRDGVVREDGLVHAAVAVVVESIAELRGVGVDRRVGIVAVRVVGGVALLGGVAGDDGQRGLGVAVAVAVGVGLHAVAVHQVGVGLVLEAVAVVVVTVADLLRVGVDGAVGVVAVTVLQGEARPDGGEVVVVLVAALLQRGVAQGAGALAVLVVEDLGVPEPLDGVAGAVAVAVAVRPDVEVDVGVGDGEDVVLVRAAGGHEADEADGPEEAAGVGAAVVAAGRVADHGVVLSVEVLGSFFLVL